MRTELFVVFTVESMKVDDCQTSDSGHILTSSSGYIPSSVGSDTPFCDGAQHHPWVITGRLGQRINLTLYDFTLQPTPVQLSNNNLTKVVHRLFDCRRYGHVTDSGLAVWHTKQINETFPICAGNERVSQVFMSFGNVVKLYFDTTARENSRFIIRYSGIL